MEMTIKVKMDNAAFENNQGGELARIIRRLADDTQEEVQLREGSRFLLDVNGNIVGEVKISE